MSFKTYILEKEKIVGGIADNRSLTDIAKKHDVSLEHITKQFKMGVSVEKEHSKDVKKCEEIAKDHLYEDPNYYSKLKKMESGK